MEKKRDLLIPYIIITFLLVFSGWFIPPIGVITPLGMKYIGIFLGVIFAWTATNSLIWPSILGFVAIGFSSGTPVTTILATCFGNEIVLFMIFILVFIGAIEELGLVDFFATWLMGRSFIEGRPWMLTAVILFGTYISAALVNEYAAIIVFWGILYSVAKIVGLKAHHKYMVLMIIAIPMIAFCFGGIAFPFKLLSMFFITMYSDLSVQAGNLAGANLNMGCYTVFVIAMSIGAILVYMLCMRFIFRVDTTLLRDLKLEKGKEPLKLSKRQKYGMFFLMLMVIILLLSDVLPDGLVLKSFLQLLGKPGTMLVLIMIMTWVKVDGKPMIDFQSASKSIAWEMIFMFAFITPFSSMLVGKDTGVQEALVSMLSPILRGDNPIIFALIILALSTLLTNFLNNGVVAVVFMSIMIPLGVTMNFDTIPVFLLLIFSSTLAFLTPAASAPAAMVFSQSAWLSAKDIFKVVPLILIILFVYYFAVGYPLATILF